MVKETSVQATALQSNDEGWKWKHTHIHHNTDLLRNNLRGQLVNNSLFHRVLQLVVAAFSCSKPEREINDEKGGGGWLSYKNINLSTFSVAVYFNSVNQ